MCVCVCVNNPGKDSNPSILSSPSHNVVYSIAE